MSKMLSSCLKCDYCNYYSRPVPVLVGIYQYCETSSSVLRVSCRCLGCLSYKKCFIFLITFLQYLLSMETLLSLNVLCIKFCLAKPGQTEQLGRFDNRPSWTSGALLPPSSGRRLESGGISRWRCDCVIVPHTTVTETLCSLVKVTHWLC